MHPFHIYERVSPLNPKSTSFNRLSRTTKLPSFKSFRSGVFVLHAIVHTHMHTHTHTHTHTYRDKVIAISASPYYVVSADNQLDALECNITRATSTLESGSAHICELSCWSQTDWQTERFVDNYDSNDRIIFFGQLRTAHASTEATYFQGCNL